MAGIRKHRKKPHKNVEKTGQKGTSKLMNYFELYPGDYMRDTGELTLAEHGAYLKLLMAYYSKEKPLPGPLPELFRICGAMTKPEREAVTKVAQEFFPVNDNGQRRKNRCDEDIEKARKRIEAAKNNGKKGGRKPNPAGNPAGNPSGSENGNPLGTPSATQSGEALQTPDPSTKEHSSKQADTTQSKPTSTGLACLAMRKAGCFQTNPNHPDLIAACNEGVTAEALASTVHEALNANPPIRKPFAWAIATARGRHADGAKQIPTGESHANHSTPGRKLSVADQIREHARNALAGDSNVIEGEVTHASPRVALGQDG